MPDNIYGRLKQANAESSNKAEFCKKAFGILLKSVGAIIFLAILLAVPVSMIVMGSVYWDDCPAEKGIPIILVIWGCVASTSLVLNITKHIIEMRKDDDEKCNDRYVGSIFNFINFVLFIVANVYVYKTKDHFNSRTPPDSNYCDHTLYWYAFWVITSNYIAAGVLVVLTCVGICCIVAASDDD